MRRLAQFSAPVLAVLAALAPLDAADPERDFSGRWVLDSAAPPAAGLSDRLLTVVQNESAIRCYASTADGAQFEWSYALNGDESHYALGEESRNSVAKWEGAALLVNTQVSGKQSYTVMDRWRLSAGHSTLTITRQLVRSGSQSEFSLVYHRENQAPAEAPAGSRPLAARPPGAPGAAEEYTVPTGTHILLSLRNSLDTKHSREGDRVYLETVYPVSAGGRMVIPRGSYVTGIVSQSKPAGAVKGKGELYIRFDSLTLPNGVTREFRSRLSNADTMNGKVDREEGKVTGERDRSRDARTTAEGAGIGATVGGVAGSAAGAPLKGVGIGAAAGAAVGLASVLTKHKAEASLPRGTTVEMVLDRDLHYQRSELR